MKKTLCALWFISFSFIFSSNLFTQQYPGGRDDSQPALQYAYFVQQLIEEEKWSEAQAAARRAGDFANASSDISYQIALVQSHFEESIIVIIDSLDKAIQTSRWVIYNENSAFLLKAQMLITLKNYYGALTWLDTVGARMGSSAQIRADAEMMRLVSLRGIALGSPNLQALAVFRTSVLNAMDRFPRDPRPLQIFFEYAQNRLPDPVTPPVYPIDLPVQSDINLLELAIRRLPFLIETDPELAWMAAPFMRDTDAARRLLASYRAGSLSPQQDYNFRPNPSSIPVALNFGLIDDRIAIEELFMATISSSASLSSPVIKQETDTLFVNKAVLDDTYKALRSEDGRRLFTQKLLGFTGLIYADEERDGYAESFAGYHDGSIVNFTHYTIQDNVSKINMIFDFNYDPKVFFTAVAGPPQQRAEILYERYPSVIQAKLGDELFLFAPADFQYAPVAFTEIGGSNAYDGLLFPVVSNQYISLTYRSLVSFCSRLLRPSLEFEGAVETIYIDRGVIHYVTEEINGMQISVTEFERGLPVVQYIDLDHDGRMETIRRFRRPPSDYVWQDLFDYRRLISSSESDFRGDGRYKTMEVYLLDGSTVYYYDLDGSGNMNYSEFSY